MGQEKGLGQRGIDPEDERRVQREEHQRQPILLAQREQEAQRA